MRETSAPKNEDRVMDMVADLLGGGRTVAYKTVLAHACGGATVGLLLSQFWYWSNQPSVQERAGWFWKMMEEITEETGLTRSEQESARRKLKEAGILQEEFRDLPRKLYFKINKPKLYEVLANHAQQCAKERISEAAINNAGNPHYGGGNSRTIERGKPASKKGQNQHSIKEQQITAEITHKNTAADSALLKGSNAPFRDDPAAAESIGKNKEELCAQSPPSTALGSLVDALVTEGLNRTDAKRLAAATPEECWKQLDYLPFVTSFKSSKGAYLRSAIEQGFGPPPEWERAQKETQSRAKQQARRDQTNAQVADNREEQERLVIFKERLQQESPAYWESLVQEAIAQLPIPVRNRPSGPAYRGALEGRLNVLLLEVMSRQDADALAGYGVTGGI